MAAPPSTSLSASTTPTAVLTSSHVAGGAPIEIEPREIERALASARPRLLRLARLEGVAPDACNDVVQETLLVAWRTRARLRDPRRLDAWLDAICRNLCRHDRRAAIRERSRQLHLLPYVTPAEHSDEALEPPDIAEGDPLVELERADQERLLERAIGRLPASLREALALCYLAELPQREAAARLKLSVSALEARLHRARRRLRQLLETDLRDEAESLGWIAAGGLTEGWRESRHWCYFCGNRRLLGSFRPLPSGNLELRMRCPGCCRPDEAFMNADDALRLRRAHSFGPAIKRLFQFGHQHFIIPLQRHTDQRCHGCGQPVSIEVRQYRELPYDFALLREHFAVVYSCPTCGILADSSAAVALLPHPAVAAFIAQHPRYVIAPEREVAYQGREAIHFGFADGAGSARLHVFADRRSLHMLDTMLE